MIPPILSESGVKALGVRLGNLFETYDKDRKPAEERWMKNLRQFRGIYDPEIEKLLPPNRSRAYPKMTRWAVIGTVAKLMQMLFPQTEKNWAVRPSPLPNLSTEDLQKVLDGLSAASQGAELTNAMIEKAIHETAVTASGRMETKMTDQLEELDFVRLARRVVFSAVLYNIGVLKGPFVATEKTRVWNQNMGTGKWEAKEQDRYKPVFDNCPVWSYYPDMTAQSLDKLDGEFERHVMIRSEVEALADRPDFMAEAIDKWLLDNLQGNFVSKWWETQMRSEKKSDRSDANAHNGRKYEVVSYFGSMTGQELKDCGLAVAEKDIGRTLRGNVWLIGQTVIKAMLSPLGDDIQMYHKFLFEEDDLSLLGNGLPDTLRDSQLSICEATRMALDNGSVTTGQNLVINVDLLVPGQNTDLQAFKQWFREGTGNDASLEAVKVLNLNSHIPELIQLINLFTAFSERESGLPPASMGDVTQGGSEALRTSQNASIFLGQAALPIRDTVRNYDVFTISVMTALVKWNMKFDADPTRKGDHQMIARGSTSLIAKEVLANSLDQFRATLDQDERPHVKTRKLLEHRAKSRDIPIDELLEDEDKANQKIAMMAQRAAALAALQSEEVQAKIKNLLTSAMKNAATAKKLGETGAIEVYTAIMNVLNDAAKNEVEVKKIDAKPKTTA